MNSFESDALDDKAVAVIGMAGRFPGAGSVEQFWQNLCDGVESVSFFSDEELLAAGVDPDILSNPAYVKAGAVLDQSDRFDAAFFGINPLEAALMDPQQRIFLECAWEALEDAGYAPERYRGLIGLYAGAAWNTYLLRNLAGSREVAQRDSDYQVFIANDKDFMPTRVSYKLNLKGPSITVQTACSTSLVAIHLAALSLLNYECDIALAGGVCVLVPQMGGYLYQEGGIDSPDGHCRAFDASAQGTIFGSGAGLVVLKRLIEAVEDGDTIYAVIKGSAINNDGSLKVSYTAPSVAGQAEVITAALALARVDPATVGYVEAHGTGTALGDPVEVAALTQAFQAKTAKSNYCALGSVKTNIGHLSVAAGVAGFIKTVLALWHGQLPPSLHYTTPNPQLNLAQSPFYVHTRLQPWPATAYPRRAGVSSFGIGGTNAHVILEQAPARPDHRPAHSAQLLLLSAKTERALAAGSANLARHLRRHPDLNLADVAYTLQVGRTVFPYRRALVVKDTAEAVELLECGDPQRVLTSPASQDQTNRPVVFLLSGQGRDYGALGRQLYAGQPHFRATVVQCAELLLPLLGLDIREHLFSEEQRTKNKEQSAQNQEPRTENQASPCHPVTLSPCHLVSVSGELDQTEYAQPVLFVLTYALARLWMDWGVRPSALLGHSLGELVAATLAGVFALPDALKLVVQRARLMQACPPGAMLSVHLPLHSLSVLLPPDCSIAVSNAPDQQVLAGPAAALQALHQQLEARGVPSRWLNTTQAFHSALMEGSVAPFTAAVAEVPCHPPQIRLLSGVSGQWLSEQQAQDAHYWGAQLRAPVRFSAALERLAEQPDWLLLEVGPPHSLAPLARRHPALSAEQVVLSSLGEDREGHLLEQRLLTTAGRLWLAGVEVDWQALHRGERPGRVSLPGYPFERERYWVEPSGRSEQAARVASVDAREAGWFYLPSWKRTLAPSPAATGATKQECWLIFQDSCGIGERLTERLKQSGALVVTVQLGDRFELLSEHAYRINMSDQEQYHALFSVLFSSRMLPTAIAHCWNITPVEPAEPDQATATRFLDASFYSLLFLVQALGAYAETTALTLTIFSNTMQHVAGETLLTPEKAALLGLCKVIPQEYAHIVCRSIDLVLPHAGMQQLIAQLINELQAPDADSIIAYRGADRWVPAYERVELPAVAGLPARLRVGGVYLITGGFGGLGSTLAHMLARRCQARLALLARTRLPERATWQEWLRTHPPEERIAERIRLVQALEALGAEVLVVQADMSESNSLEAALVAVRERFGGLDGVIHAAGEAGGALLEREGLAEAAAVLGPKVAGTRALLKALADQHLEFVLLYSSLSALVGGIGQASYAAANAVLDAFALDAAARGLPVSAINWDAWQDVGMAARSVFQTSSPPTRHHAPIEATGHPLIETCIQKTASEAIYESRFSADQQWVLDEHRIDGLATMPGTAYLEMARAACAHFAALEQLELHNVLFLTPLIVYDDTPIVVQTQLKRSHDGIEIRIISLDSQQGAGHRHEREHMRALARPAASHRTRRHDLLSFIQRCGGAMVPTTPGQLPMTGTHMCWGRRWHSLNEVAIGGSEAFAALELPLCFRPDLNTFLFHPAIVDVATSFALPWLGMGEYLPVATETIRLYGPLPGKVYSYVTVETGSATTSELLTMSVVLMDDRGVERASIERLTLRRIDQNIAVALKKSVDRRGATTTSEPVPAQISRLLQQHSWIQPEEGLQIVLQLLAHRPLPQIIVTRRDLTGLITEMRSLTRAKQLDALTTRYSGQSVQSRPALSTEYAAPQTELERGIVQIWETVLGIEPIGIYDDFFELGGHSLLAMQVLSRLRDTLQLPIQLRHLFEATTVAGLAEQIEQIRPDPNEPKKPPIRAVDRDAYRAGALQQ